MDFLENIRLDNVEIYNINTSQWSQTDRLPMACCTLSGVVSKDVVYLVGGHDNKQRQNKTFAASIDELISNAVPVTKPSEEQSANASLKCASAWNEVVNTPAYRSPVVCVSDTVLAMGGARSSDLSEWQPVKDIYAYSTSMNSWIHVGELPTPVGAMTLAALSPTEFLVIGGVNEDKTKLRTVYKGSLNITM